jgi:hypothetical protein
MTGPSGVCVAALAQASCGVFLLLSSLKHPTLSTRLRSAWTQADTGGMAQLGDVFPSGSVTLQWTNTGSGRLDPVVVSTVTVALAQQSVTPLNDSSPSLEVYTSSLWYEGTGPAWQTWPSSDWYTAVRCVANATTTWVSRPHMLTSPPGLRAPSSGRQTTR